MPLHSTTGARRHVAHQTGRVGCLPMLVLLILLVIGGGAYILFRDTTEPTASLSPMTTHISKALPMLAAAEDDASGVRRIQVRVRANEETYEIASQDFPEAPVRAELPFTLADLPLSSGVVTIEVAATDASYASLGSGNTVVLASEHTLDTQPPQISITSGVINVNRGGAAGVAFTVSEPPAMAGVVVGDHFFPAYEQENGTWACLFAFPHFMTVENFSPALMAVDAAGNENVIPLNVNARPKTFREDTINLPDSFLERKMPEFASLHPEAATPLEIFLAVNRKTRVENRAALKDIGRTSVPRPLWRGAFERMAGASMAQFADHRSYIYNGEVVDNQTHLGQDIASVQRAPVPAGNHGVVVFAGYMGIYGNCVIIDHGMGLMTLYAHLTEVHVQEGQQLTKGDIVGSSGTSGLAGGDHLHFGVLVGGLPVSPIEWWDEHWILDNLTGKVPGVGEEAS